MHDATVSWSLLNIARVFCVSALFCVTGRVSLCSFPAFTAFGGLILQACQVSSISLTGRWRSSGTHIRSLHPFDMETGLFWQALYPFHRETGLFGPAYLRVGAALYDLPPVEHDDAVGADDCGEAVRDDDG